MITFASRVKLWKRATGGCFVGCLESEEGNLDRMKFEEKFFLPPGPLGRIDWDTLRVLLSFVDYRRIHREPQEASEFSLLKFSFTNIPCMINDIFVAKPFSQSRAAQEVALLDTANLFVLGNKWKELPKKSWALSPDVIQHVGRKKRWGWFLLQQWNTQNWWQAPLCNRAHCYILQCPISGLRKMYNGGWDERELIEKELSKKRKARFPLFFARINLFAL